MSEITEEQDAVIKAGYAASETGEVSSTLTKYLADVAQDLADQVRHLENQTIPHTINLWKMERQKAAELESALASERAKTAAAEATIAQVRANRGRNYSDIDTILAAAPTAAFDAALAEARAGALEEADAMVVAYIPDPHQEHEECDDCSMARELSKSLRVRATEIREAQK